MAVSFKVVIPARMASTRLPRKALADIAGKPMVVRVAEAALRSRAEEVWIATDHEEIRAAALSHGLRAEMTDPRHASGTERIAELAARRGWDDAAIVVNVQGDEPLLVPELIDAVAEALAGDAAAAMATACHPITEPAELYNPNVVKVVRDARGRALYFSRAAIPWDRQRSAAGGLPAVAPQRHIGLYAYRAGFLRAYSALTPSPLESCEALEQLRVLWHGYPIQVVEAATTPAPGVDTPEDLERVRRAFDRNGN